MIAIKELPYPQQNDGIMNNFNTIDLVKTTTLFICSLFLNVSIVFFVLESGSFLPSSLSYFLSIVIAFTISKTLQDDILQSTNFYLTSNQKQTSILLKKSDIFYIAIAAAGAFIFFLKIVKVELSLPHESWRGEVEALISLFAGGTTAFFVYFLQCRTVYCATIASKESVASVVANEDIVIYSEEDATVVADTDIDLLRESEKPKVETIEVAEIIEDEKIVKDSLNETQKKIVEILERQEANGGVNITKLSKEAGVNRSTVYRNLEKMGININNQTK